MARRYTALEAFWETPELIAICFELMDKPTLSICARLSNRLSEHALNTLYRDGPGYLQIFKLLGVMKTDGASMLYSYRDDMTPAHWDRFRHYSSRIQSLAVHYRQDGFLNISDGAMIDILATLPQGEVLLPSLRKLEWEDNCHGSTFPFITIMFHNRLQDVHLKVDDIDVNIILQHLARRSPVIKTLHLKMNETPVRQRFGFIGMQNEIAEIVKSFRSLHSIALPPELYSVDAIRNLSFNSGLVRLWLTTFAIKETKVDDRERQREIHDRSPDNFTGLRALSLTSVGLINLSNTPIAGYMAGIVSLHVEILQEDHPSGFLRLVATSYPNLRDLVMIYAMWRPPLTRASFQGALTMDLLEPLLSMRRLQSLVLDHPVPPNLSDADLGRLALAFPELKHLELCVQASGDHQEKVPTLSCLLPFAEHCRKLISIGIYIDAAVRPPIITPEKKTFAASLRVMQVFCSKIGEDHFVVDFLAAMLPPEAELTLTRHSDRLVPVVGKLSEHFPPVDSDTDLDDTSKKHRRRWEEVGRLLADLRSVRGLLASGRQQNEEA
ncbi:hypothetical protein SISNIDRAFT_454290 [Sistotremastrum niveocremeum HHB9708]|uniref:F-box domain-containing protein n=1 Tax=Sistotremastrum niveocremeum HHB9708 TaxID=1314777 RepID=A0A164V5Y7_9AGAM|nr:hypothetical protein SISNIDRAFT_454290 [Sistotremastrum niveocremeum HHB9708]